MTIQQAISSGKPFRRKRWDFWLITFQNRFWVWREHDNMAMIMQFEVEIPKKTMRGKGKNRWHKKKGTWKPLPNPEPMRIEVVPSAILADDWEIKR